MTTSDIERIFDLQRLKKSRRRWRIFGVLAIAAVILAAFASNHDWARERDHIARLRIDGLITGDEKTLAVVRAIGASDKVKGVIIRIDSPGGTTVGSEALYDELRKVAKDKPVAAVMDSVAASGGYITALAADHIVAHGNTITGSIGVIFSFPEVSKLLDTLGIKMEEIKSGELKAEPTPYKPVSDRVRAVTNDMVQEAFSWFLGLVSERRSMDMAKTRMLGDGRVYSGRQAVANGLIDELGGEDAAISWMEDKRQVAVGLDIIEWAPAADTELGILGYTARLMGWPHMSQLAARAQLDGLLVLWHPQF